MTIFNTEFITDTIESSSGKLTFNTHHVISVQIVKYFGQSIEKIEYKEVSVLTSKKKY